MHTINSFSHTFPGKNRQHCPELADFEAPQRGMEFAGEQREFFRMLLEKLNQSLWLSLSRTMRFAEYS